MSRHQYQCLKGLLAFVAACLLIVAHVVPALAQTAQEQPAKKNILLLYSYGHGGRGVGVFDDALLTVLNAGGYPATSLFFEYLDLERNKAVEGYPARTAEFLLRKYANRKIDLVIAVQQPARDFLLGEGRLLAPDAPAVTVQAAPIAEAATERRQLLSLLSQFDVKKTLELALELFPQTERVLFASGSSEADLKMVAQAKSVAIPHQGQLQFEYTTDLSLENMLSRVATLPPKSIIIFVQYNTDINGRTALSYEVEGMITKVANAPVFGLYDFNLSNGGIGGSVVSVKELGDKTGRVALDLLQGKRRLAQQITNENIDTVPMFDWLQLKRWAGEVDGLPKGSIFVNRAPTMWEQYARTIVWVALLVVAQFLMIAALIMARRRSVLMSQSLHDSERRFRSAIEEAPFPIMIHAEDGAVLALSRAWTEISGYSIQDIPTVADWTRKAYSEQMDMFGAGIATLYDQEGRRDEGDHEVRCRDGSRHAWQFSSVGLGKASDGRRIAISMAADITERKLAEEKLRLSEEGLAITLQSIGDAVIATDAAGLITRMNATAERLTGWSKVEALGRPLLEVFHIVNAQTRAPSVNPVQLVMERGAIVGLANHTALLARGGAEYQIADSAAPIRNADGAIVGVVLVFSDVTEDYRVRQSLAVTVQQLERTGAIARVGGWELDLPVMTFSWTLEARRIHEVDAAFAPTLDMAINFYAPEARPAIQEALHAAVENGTPFDLELPMITAKGRHIWTRHQGTAVMEDGRAIRLVGVLQDITERKQAEIVGAQLEAQLRESQKMEALGTLAGGVAHDFNNALAAIMGNTELARQDVGPGHLALKSLEEIGKASRRARDLVQQILAFGRRQTLERKLIPLAPVVQEAAKLLRATLPAGIELKVECSPDAPAVLADSIQIEQVLLNMGTNSWHAIQGQERPGTIEIRLRSDVRDGARVASLAVRDNGRGMDKTTRSRIFEPFFTTKGVGEGTGLGLSVVHGIVKDHHASIDVHSVPGQGTTFVIWFPAAQPSDASSSTPGMSTADAKAKPAHGLTGDGKHILYVDDDEAIVFLTMRLLERQGYHVSGHTDPFEAVAAVRANPFKFDLAVTDFNMPGMSGLEVARLLKEIRPDLPVAMASGYITDELRQKAPTAGVSELIYKPNTVDVLCEVVARLADGRGETANWLHTAPNPAKS